MKSRRKVFVVALSYVVYGTLAGAQDTSSHTTPSRDTMAPVRITALRTPFDMSKIPFAVDIVTPRDGSVARPGLSLDEVFGHVAGVQADNRFNFALGDRISIRGLGARAQFGVRGVRVIVDDIPATLADGQTVLNNVDLASFGTAQVLRGPASSVYGNASGGVLLLESAPPPAVPFAGRAQLLTGSDGLRQGELGVAGSNGKWNYLVNGDQLDYGGYRAFSHAKNTHVNALAGYETQTLKLKFVANVEHHDAQNPGSLSDSLLQLDRRQAFANNVAQATGERGTQIQTGTSARIQLPLGEVRLSGYVLHRALVNPIPTNIIDLSRNAGGVRSAYAVTLGSSQQSITPMIGVEADLQRDDRKNYTNIHGANGALTLNQQEHVTSASPFAQISGILGPAAVFGGIRYDRFRFSAADRLITSDNPDDSGVRDMTAFSPALGVSYTLRHNMTIYANAATSFQTPTTTELANRPNSAGGFNPTLGPEHVRSLEAGMHGQLGTRQVYRVSIYHMRITDELVPFQVPSAPDRTFYRNATVAQHHGIEVDDRILLTSLLSAHIAYSTVSARIISDTANGSANVGKRVPGISPGILTMSLDAGQSDGLFASLETRSERATPVNDPNTMSSPGYTVVNARLNAPIPHTGVSVAGGMNNVLDTRYNSSVVINAVGGRYFEPAPGRTVYLGLTWR